jgi:hypothetical protein
MTSIHSSKVLVLGGLLFVTLAAGCAGGHQWSNSGDGYSGAGYGSAYPNLDGSAGSYPYNSVYARSSPDKSDYQSSPLYNNGGDTRYGSGNGNRDRGEEPNPERRADLGHDRSAKADKDSAPVYR